MKLTILARPCAAIALALALINTGHAAAEGTVDVNTADAEAIADVLVGVGLEKASAIVRHREEHGRFTDIYDLTRVRGIGEATVAKNESRITLTEGSETPPPAGE